MAKKSTNNKNNRCAWCGRPLGAESIVAKNVSYCCEGCHLGDLAFKDAQIQQNKTHLALAESLASALDAREHETGLHSKRVACHTIVLARLFSDNKEYLRQIYWGALLHDIGKIAIPDVVLLKDGPLTESEWRVMRSHPSRGYEILANVPFMQEAAAIVLNHEERFDGGGYPAGLVGEAIPWGARLFAIIDTLDAITSDRPYRKSKSFDSAKNEIIAQSGRQFDPRAVKAFQDKQDVLQEMVALKCMATPDIW